MRNPQNVKCWDEAVCVQAQQRPIWCRCPLAGHWLFQLQGWWSLSEWWPSPCSKTKRQRTCSVTHATSQVTLNGISSDLNTDVFLQKCSVTKPTFRSSPFILFLLGLRRHLDSFSSLKETEDEICSRETSPTLSHFRFPSRNRGRKVKAQWQVLKYNWKVKVKNVGWLKWK